MGLFFKNKETNFKVGKYYQAKEVIEALKNREEELEKLGIDFEPVELGSKGISTGKFAFKAIPKKVERKTNKSHREWADSLVVKNLTVESSYGETGTYANLGQEHSPIYRSDDEER